jgi:hypothetical protein
MNTWTRYLIVLVTFLIASGAAYWYYGYIRDHSSFSDVSQVRMTVSSFGDQLQKMPLIADQDLIDKGMDIYYGVYIHQDLLAKWKADPLHAPGRLTSSPWPDRIEVTNTTKTSADTYTVDANIIEVANGNGGTEVVSTIPVTFTLTRGPDGWQITGYSKK